MLARVDINIKVAHSACLPLLRRGGARRLLRPRLALARDLLKDVRKSGLRSPYADALLRRLALARWTKMDRPRPSRLETKDCKETAILLFFMNSWEATYEDLGIALSVSEDRARHLVHKGRMDQVATLIRIPIPRPECRRPRELLSDFREGRLSEPLADDVAQHLRGCRDCSALDRHLRDILSAPPRPLIEPPPELRMPESRAQSTCGRVSAPSMFGRSRPR